MTSKEIIVKLIDGNLITGEEAYVLMNDVLKGEMVAANEILRGMDRNSNIYPSSWATTYSYNSNSGIASNTSASALASA